MGLSSSYLCFLYRGYAAVCRPSRAYKNYASFLVMKLTYYVLFFEGATKL